MVLKQLMEVYELIDRADASGAMMEEYLRGLGARHIRVETLSTEIGSTDFVRVTIPGGQGKLSGGKAPTLGILGRLGGIGARPERIGLVSDGDGAWAALALAAKLLDMQRKGDTLPGDVIVCTHICPDAPTEPHDPVPFMGSPVDMQDCNRMEVDADMDAILSIDTTKGNLVMNHKGFAISPTVLNGWILKTSADLLELMGIVSGRQPEVFPLAMQDITPYGNGVSHLNSILQPATAAKVPVVGVALTTDIPVPGCATGASHYGDVECACRFVLEVAKAFGAGKCSFYSEEEYTRLQQLYGSMDHLLTMGKE